MDLLCTENIMHEYETEILCHHHQQSFKAEQNQHQQQLQQQQQQKQHQQQQRTVVSKSNTSPPSVYSSSSSLSSSSCSSTNSSGYNSSSSNSNSGSYHSSKATCEENYNSSYQHIQQHQQQTQQQQQQLQLQLNHQQQHQSQQIYQNKPNSSSSVFYHGNSSSAGQNVYSNNLIARSLDYVNTATEDPTFLTNRCLENALKAEEKRPQPVCTYFNTVQKDITPPMRKIVAEWMMEVCAEEKCQEEVVLLALNYMDRFLSTKSVRKTHLQILAAACLLLASKLREPSCRALSAELLVFYTDNSIHKADLIKWELYVLSRLGWDLSCVTPLDFLELLLIRVPIRSNDYPDLDVDKVRQHAQAFISLAAKEHQFSMYTASTIAASSIAAALSGLNWHLRTGQNLRYLLNLLTDLTSVEQDYLHDCMMKMETIFEEHSRNLQPYLGSAEHNGLQQQNGSGHMNESTTSSFSSTAAANAVTQSQYSQNPQYHHYHAYQNPENRQFNHSNSHSHHHQHQPHLQPQHSHHLHHNSQTHHSASSASSAPSASNSLSGHEIVTGSVTANVLLPNLTQSCKMQANAQKEVQDIKF